jgi:hypothetical protein
MFLLQSNKKIKVFLFKKNFVAIFLIHSLHMSQTDMAFCFMPGAG